MKKIFSVVLIILVFIGLWLFVKSWRHTSQLGVGTGRIAGIAGDVAAHPGQNHPTVHSDFHDIIDDPAAHAGQQASVSGRVRGPGKLASNRNIYMLDDEGESILIIDDSPAPKEYEQRTVTGTVKVIGPPIGGLRRAYIVSVSQGAKFVAPTWSDIKDYFTKSPNG